MTLKMLSDLPKARIHQGKQSLSLQPGFGHLRGPMYGSREQLIGRAAQVARYGHEGRS